MDLQVSVQKNFGPFELRVDFALSASRIGIFGESGSGKSTLVNFIAGLSMPDTGSIFLDGECLYSDREGIFVPPERRRIALVFQQAYLFPHLTVKGNLLYGYRRCAAGDRNIDFDSLVDVLKIQHLLKRGVNHLSGGEKQRVAIGRAVLSNPRLLLLDEPLAGLDENLKFEIIPYLNTVCEKFAVPFLFISHSMMEMRLMTEKLIVLHQGKVAEATTAEQLARRKMGHSRLGYLNLLKLKSPRKADGFLAYPWGGTELLLLPNGAAEDSVFELSARDIFLTKKAPEMASGRNVLQCRVGNLFVAGRETGIEMECGGDRLIAEISSEGARELDLEEGMTVYAVISPSALRPLI
jgi:molybdate transport system ATP-binding protein